MLCKVQFKLQLYDVETGGAEKNMTVMINDYVTQYAYTLHYLHVMSK